MSVFFFCLLSKWYCPSRWDFWISSSREIRFCALFNHVWKLEALVLGRTFLCVFVPLGVNWTESGRHKQRLGAGIRSRQLQKVLYAVNNSHWIDKNSIEQNAVFPSPVFRFSDERRVVVYRTILYIAVRGNVEWRVAYVLWLCCAVTCRQLTAQPLNQTSMSS